MDSDVIQAIERAIQLKDQYNIRIINLSLGRAVYTSFTADPLCDAVEAAYRAGIVVVVAAGNMGRDNSFENQGYGTIAAPANSPFVITVGAINTKATETVADDVMTSFSSKGPSLIDQVVKPDLVAPGNRIFSVANPGGLLYQTLPSTRVTGFNGPYQRMGGTSMAAPMVAGVAALMLEHNPALTPDQVKAALMRTASKNYPAVSLLQDAATGTYYTVQSDIFTVGAGVLDAYAAVTATELLPQGVMALSPAVRFDAQTGAATLVDGTSLMWGSSVLWGSSVVWGSSVMWGNSTLGGSSVVWGTSVVWGSNVFLSGSSVLWGNSVVWGSSATQSFSILWGTSSPYANSVLWGSSIHAKSVMANGDR